jgi:hypothetical protein
MAEALNRLIRLIRSLHDIAAQHACTRLVGTTVRGNGVARASYAYLGAPINEDKLVVPGPRATRASARPLPGRAGLSLPALWSPSAASTRSARVTASGEVSAVGNCRSFAGTSGPTVPDIDWASFCG